MPRIHLLSSRLANQIAAGEVVERPASVVKEVLENSLDAGATRVDIEVESGGGKLIRIRDNGGGMDEKTLEKIFTPFFTTKSSEDCIGLGLYIVQNLIEKIGGRIEVESKLGRGSNFRIILDL